MSSASRPASIASTASASSSPALTPTMPAPEDAVRLGLDDQLRQPVGAAHRQRAAGGGPREARGLVPRCPRPWPGSRSARSRRPRGRCRRPTGSSARPRRRPRRAITSAASEPSCVALWASIGSPRTSPIEKMCGTLVRICTSDAMKPRSSTATPAASAPMTLPLGLRPDRDEDAVEDLGVVAELDRQALVGGLDRLDAGLEVDRLVAALDALLEHADQVLVGARDQLVEQLDDRDLGAQRVVDRRHLEADDAAADDQQPLRDLRRPRARPWSP